MSSVILGLLGVAALLLWYGNELKKDGSSGLYYLCFFASTFFIPLTLWVVYLISIDVYPTNANLQGLLSNSFVSFLSIWLIMVLILVIKLFQNFIIDSWKKPSEELKQFKV